MKEMRLTVFLLFIHVFFFANTIYSQNNSVSLHVSNVNYLTVFNEIEQQTGYRFFYSENQIDLSRNISLNKTKVKINELLDEIFTGTDISYKIVEKYIVLVSESEIIKKRQNPGLIITGVITSATDGSTIPGVNIRVKNSVFGTISDTDGNFSIEINDENPVLVFSYVGYVTREVNCAGKKRINLVLHEDIHEIGEVMVVGYGTESKKLITSSVQKISFQETKFSPVQTVQTLLQGKASGLQISLNTGTPGAAVSVRIRGNSSISAGNQPLYVIDGIPVASGDYSLVDFYGQGINSITEINPNDIESVTVLRDAAATVIYGARGTNGVILINTKKGNAERTVFGFNTFTGIQMVWKPFRVLNAKQFKEYKNELLVNSGELPLYTHDDIDKNETDTDWMSEILQTGIISGTDLTIGGGNGKSKFFISGGYFSQEGVVIGTFYKRYNTRFNFEHSINKKFKIGCGISGSYSENKRVEGDQSLNGPLPNAMTMPPVFPVYKPDGTFDESGPYANPVAIAMLSKNNTTCYKNLGNFYADYNFLSGFVLKTKTGFDILNLSEHCYDPTTTRQGAKYNGLGIESDSHIANIVNTELLTYNKSVNKHAVEALLGYSFETFKRNSSYLNGINFPNERFEYLSSAAVIKAWAGSAFTRAMHSYFTQLKYNFGNKYLLSVSMRCDGSSKFGKNNRYGFFPSVSVGWRLTEEPFLARLKQINDFKIRLSYGITGNDGVSDFASLSLYNGGANYLSESGIYPSQLPNADLKWESTGQFNMGVDIELFGNNVNLVFDYYYKHTKDLLLNRPVSFVSGFGFVADNIGELENKGIELTVNTVNLKNNLTWHTSLSFSANRNKVLKLYNDQPIDAIGRGNNRIQAGKPISVFYGYKSKGVNPLTGDLVFEDLNNDQQITSADRTVIGNPNPDFIGGIGNLFMYKQFSLNVFLQFSYGNDVFNGTRRYTESLGITPDNQSITVLNRWRKPGDITNVPRAGFSDPNGNNRISSRFIEDGSFLRVKNVTFSYSFEKDLIARIKLTSLKLYFSAQNLFTYTKYSGMDPEVNYAGDNNTIAGTDFFTYPQVRILSAGIEMIF